MMMGDCALLVRDASGRVFRAGSAKQLLYEPFAARKMFFLCRLKISCGARVYVFRVRASICGNIGAKFLLKALCLISINLLFGWSWRCFYAEIWPFYAFFFVDFTFFTRFE